MGKAGSGQQRWPHRCCQVPEHIPAPQRAWCRGSLQLSRALGAFLSVPQFPPCFLRRHPGAATALPRDGEQGEQRGGTVTVAEHGEVLARGWAGGPAGGQAVPCRAVPCITGRCCAIRYHTSPCRAVPSRAPRRPAVRPCPLAVPPPGSSPPGPPGCSLAPRAAPAPPPAPTSAQRGREGLILPPGRGRPPGLGGGPAGAGRGALSSGPWRLLAQPRPGAEIKAPERTGDEKQEEVSRSQRPGTGVLPAHPKTLGIIH